MLESLQTNTTISHYRILEKLGAGGMGEVFLAEDTKLDRPVVLKILPEDLAHDAERMRRFVQEAKSASALNHPNIITIYEIGQFADAHFIAAEYIAGDTLHDHLQSEPPSLKFALDVAIQIASALDAAHHAGIIHRDIKPENVMIRPDGLIKVLDFGIAKLTEKKAEPIDAEAATAIKAGTSAGVIIGTASYMSPEQARGKAVDARSDIFSFGIVLYEMLAGEKPFAGWNAIETIAAILHKEPAPLNETDVPGELWRVVEKCLRKDCDERYQTAKDVLIDLRDIKQDLEFQDKLERAAPPNHSETKTEIINAAPTDKTGQSGSAATTGSSYQNYKFSLAVSLIVLLAAIGLGVWFYANRNAKQIESIAVMPFVNESGNADVEYLSDGMTETLISSLSQIPKLKVKARSSVFRYKGKETDVKKIAQELNVQAILNGRVVQRGEQLTLSLELVDARTENVIWSEQYNRRQTDLVSLQSEIARDVSNKLRVKLSGADEQKLAKNYTANAEAYKLYLQGRFHWNKRTGEEVRKSVEYFQQAIEQDPSYALAFAGLADAYSVIPSYSNGSPDEFFPKAKASARRALELDESLAEAHTALARVLFAYDWNFPESDREYQRAIELNPNYATAHHWYGNANLLRTGRFDEAIAEMKRAQELDPLSLIINADLGETYLIARRYDEAIEQLRKTIEMDERFHYAHWWLGIAYQMKGSYREAIVEYKRAKQLNDNPWMLALLGQVYAVSGNKDEALKSLAQLKEISKQQYIPPFHFAVIYAALGEKEQAFQWLEKSYQDRGQELTRLKVDPFLDLLRDDPRFADLVSRMGLQP